MRDEGHEIWIAGVCDAAGHMLLDSGGVIPLPRPGDTTIRVRRCQGDEVVPVAVQDGAVRLTDLLAALVRPTANAPETPETARDGMIPVGPTPMETCDV